MRSAPYSRVLVNRDMPDENLKRGGVATLVEYVPHPHGEEDGAILEIFTVLGDSIGIATVPVSAIQPLTAEYVPAVRVSERADDQGAHAD